MKNKTAVYFGIALIASIFLILSTPHITMATPVVIKFAHVDPEDVQISKKGAAARVFKDMVEAETGGAIEVKLFPAGQLGGERELIESAKLGSLQMCMISGPVAAYFKPAMVLDIPYLFPSAPVAWKVLDGKFGQELADALLKQTGLRALAYGETGFRNFTNSKKPIKSPADLEKLKIRVMETPLYITLVKSLGGSPTPIAWPEVYTALQQGVVDGQENPVSVILQAKFAEVQKYLTLDGHTYGTDFILINEGFFKGLTEEQKAIVKRAAIVAGTCSRANQQLNSAMGVATLKAAGMEIYSPTTKEREEFKNKTQKPVMDWMKGEVDPLWIEKVQAAVKEAEAGL